MPPMSGGGGGIPPASSSSGGGGIPHSSGGGGIPVIGAAIGFGENTLLSSSCVMSVKSKPSISSLFWSTAVVEVVKCDTAKIDVNLDLTAGNLFKVCFSEVLFRADRPKHTLNHLCLSTFPWTSRIFIKLKKYGT